MDVKTPQELLEFMNNNIEYGYIDKTGKIHIEENDWYNEYKLETPSELLETKYGNCFDQTEFERDWFLKNNYEIKTIFEMVNLDYENIYPTHSFLVYKDNNKWYWFEHADFNNRGIHEFDNLEELIENQYNRYVEFLKEFNITEEELDKIIITEFSKPNNNIGAKEYLEHVINSKKIR